MLILQEQSFMVDMFGEWVGEWRKLRSHPQNSGIIRELCQEESERGNLCFQLNSHSGSKHFSTSRLFRRQAMAFVSCSEYFSRSRKRTLSSLFMSLLMFAIFALILYVKNAHIVCMSRNDWQRQTMAEKSLCCHAASIAKQTGRRIG